VPIKKIQKKEMAEWAKRRSVRQAGRHHMAIQEKSSRMAEKEWIPEDLTEARANQKDFCSEKKRC